MISGSGLKTRARMLLTPLPSGEQPAFIMLVAAASGQLLCELTVNGGVKLEWVGGGLSIVKLTEIRALAEEDE
jgi:hypothetical protein